MAPQIPKDRKHKGKKNSPSKKKKNHNKNTGKDVGRLQFQINTRKEVGSRGKNVRDLAPLLPNTPKSSTFKHAPTTPSRLWLRRDSAPSSPGPLLPTFFPAGVNSHLAVFLPFFPSSPLLPRCPSHLHFLPGVVPVFESRVLSQPSAQPLHFRVSPALRLPVPNPLRCGRRLPFAREPRNMPFRPACSLRTSWAARGP